MTSDEQKPKQQEQTEETAEKIHVKESFKILWNIAVKNEFHVKRREIVPLKESENDRVQLDTLYPLLKQTSEYLLDSRALLALTTMQNLRDLYFLKGSEDPKLQILLMAWEVKQRQHSLFFLSGPVSKYSLPYHLKNFGASQAHSEDEIDQIVVAADEVTPTLNIPDLEKEILFDETTIQNLKENLLKKLTKKNYWKLNELERELSLVELQILPRLIPKNLICLFNKKKKTIKFLPTKDNNSLMKEKKVRTLVISAKNKR